MQPESDIGNTEYKRSLSMFDNEHINHIISQLKWRLYEGDGEAIYFIGVDDNGTIYGFTDEDDMNTSIKVISDATFQSDAKIYNLEYLYENEKKYIKVTIRKNMHELYLNESRIAFIGDSFSGKSTFLGHILYGMSDDGDGNLKILVCNHLHELNTGKTSSIKTGIIGTTNNMIYNYKNCKSYNEICNMSKNIVTFIDLPGDSKYIQTILSGMMNYQPNYYFLFINPMDEFTSDKYNRISIYIKCCQFLKVNLSIIITKSDLATNQIIHDCIEKIKNILITEITIVDENYDIEYQTEKTYLFEISSVTNYGISKFNDFIIWISKQKFIVNNKNAISNTEFHITDKYYFQDIGCIVAGIMFNGIIDIKKKYLIGPFADDVDRFKYINIESIHNKRIPCSSLLVGTLATIKLSFLDNTYENEKKINKNMIIISSDILQNPKESFDADLTLWFHPSKLRVNSKITVHIRNTIQPCIITNIYNNTCELLQTMTSRVTIKFMKNPENICINDKFIFCDLPIFGFGTVII